LFRRLLPVRSLIESADIRVETFDCSDASAVESSREYKGAGQVRLKRQKSE